MPLDTSTCASRAQENLEAALRLAALGLRVFPCGPDKRPRVKAWGGAASTDQDRLRAWWRQWPDAIPAMPTGAGLAVVDLDRKDGRDGLAAWAELGQATPQGLVVETPSGGRHLYFEGTARTTGGQLGPGIDTRGEGGFVVAPGAVLPDGRRYRAISGDPVFAAWGLLDPLPALPWPQRDPDAAPAEPGGADLPSLMAALAHLPPHLPTYGDWLAVLQALHHASAGSAAGLHLALAWGAAQPYRDKTPADLAKEIRQKWSGLKADRPDAVTVGTLYRLAREHGWQPVGADAFDDEPDAGDAPEGGDDLAGLRFLSPADCAAAPVRPYLVKGLIEPGQVGAVFGEPGAGKSVLAPHLAYAVSQGRPVFGRRTRQGPVWYLAAEDPTGLQRRIEALAIEHGDAPALAVVTGLRDLLGPAPLPGRKAAPTPQLRALLDRAKRDRPALIVIDTLAAAFPGLDENTAEAMHRLRTIARALARQGAAVIAVHHPAKGGDSPRGHSVLNGDLDFSIFVKRDGEIVRCTTPKNRSGPEMAFAFRIRPVDLPKVDADGDPITAPVADELAPQEAETGPRLKPTEQAALRLIEEMAGSRGEVDEAEWRAAAIEGRAISGSDHKDNRRRVVDKAVRDLVRAGVVTAADGRLRLAEFSRRRGIFHGDVWGFDEAH